MSILYTPSEEEEHKSLSLWLAAKFNLTQFSSSFYEMIKEEHGIDRQDINKIVTERDNNKIELNTLRKIETFVKRWGLGLGQVSKAKEEKPKYGKQEIFNPKFEGITGPSKNGRRFPIYDGDIEKFRELHQRFVRLKKPYRFQKEFMELTGFKSNDLYYKLETGQFFYNIDDRFGVIEKVIKIYELNQPQS